MPDLSDLLTSQPDKPFLLHQLIGAETSFPEKMLAYRRIFIRLADKAVRDYNDARQHVLLLIGRQKSGALDIADGRLLMNLITNRLEDCLITARRLFGFFERVKSDPTKFPMDRTFKKRVDALEKSIRDVRDGIVHADEHIHEDRVDAWPPPVLSLDERTTAITVGGTTLSTEALSRAIRHLHGFASEFAKHQYTSESVYKEMPRSGPLRG
jgi:hypothetical protein